EPIVFAAIEEDQLVFQQFVKGSEVFAKKRAARLRDDVFFHVGENQRNLLAHSPEDAPPRRLQLRQTRFDDVGLLGTVKIFTSLADPFLTFQNQVGELIAEFLGKAFQDRQPE